MKKIFSAILLMAAMAFSVSTFVSCNDLAAEIEAVEGTTGENASKIAALETALKGEIATLKTAVEAADKAAEDAQKTADQAVADAAAAKAAADAAASKGDAAAADAKKAADAAKAAADDAIAAAAAASTNAKAIEEALTLVQGLKTAYETEVERINTELAGKVSKAELDAAIEAATKTVAGSLEVINARIDNLDKKLTDEIAKINEQLKKYVTTDMLSEEVEKLLKKDAALADQIAALEAAIKAGFGEGDVNITESIQTMIQMLQEAQMTIFNLYNQINMENGIAEQVAEMAETVKANKTSIEELWNDIFGENSTIFSAINGLSKRMEDAENAIEANKTSIDKLWAEISGLGGIKEQIAQINKVLNKRVDELEQEIADINDFLATVNGAINHAANKVLKSIAYIPKTLDANFNEIEGGFITLKKCNNLVETKFDFVTSSCVEFHYRVNPIDARITEDEVSFIGRKIEVNGSTAMPLTKAEGDIEKYLEVVGFEALDGEIVVKARLKEDIDIIDETIIVALQVANDNYVIVSDYVAIADNDVNNYAIVNPENGMMHFNVHWHDNVIPLESLNTKTQPSGYAFYPEQPSVGEIIPVELVYSEKVCLLDYVSTFCFDEPIEDLLDEELPCVDITYDFTLPETYLSPVDKVTNQQVFVDWANQADGILEVKPRKDIADAEAAKIVAVGKTPIVQVVAKANGVAIAKAYIKVDIVEEPTVIVPDKQPLVVEVNTKTYQYTDLTPSTSPITVTAKTGDYMTWDDLTTKVLADEGIYMSNQQFEQNYDVDNTKYDVEYDNDLVWSKAAVAFGADVNAETATTTSWFAYALDNTIHENCSGTVTITVPSTDPKKYPDLKLIFKFVVKHEAKFPEFNGLYNIKDGDKDIVVVKGHATPGADFRWTYELYMHEAFKLDTYYTDVCVAKANHSPWAITLDSKAITPGTPASYATLIDEVTNPADADKKDWEETRITLDPNTDEPKENILVDFTPALGADGKVVVADYKKAGNKKTGVKALVWPASGQIDVPVILYTVLANGNKCEKKYDVRFENPFDVTLKPTVLATDLDGTEYDVLPTDITITYGGEAVYAEGKYTERATELGLVSHLGHEYSILGKSVNDEIAKGINPYTYGEATNWLNWTDLGMIYWNNGGTKLGTDVKIDATVYGYCDQIGWFTITDAETKGMVTLQATK